MKKVLFIVVFLSFFVLGACSSQVDSFESSEENSKILILTSFYPVEEITKAIVEDTAQVKVLVGSGVEPHSFEPSPRQIVEFSNADVFVRMGGLFEHIEEDIISANPNIKVIDATHNVKLIKEEEHDYSEEEQSHEQESHDEHSHEEEAQEHHDEHFQGEYDPHVWLSIHNMEAMTEEILELLVEMYPQNKELYEANAQVYLTQLETLEAEYETRLSQCTHSEIIVNHKAFAYLAHEYNFEQISVAGFSPESEPSPQTIQRVIDEAKEHNLSYVFSEGQLDKKTAQTIAKDISGEVLELNPIKLREEETYLSIMRVNLENLVKGLDCKN